MNNINTLDICNNKNTTKRGIKVKKVQSTEN